MQQYWIMNGAEVYGPHADLPYVAKAFNFIRDDLSKKQQKAGALFFAAAAEGDECAARLLLIPACVDRMYITSDTPPADKHDVYELDDILNELVSMQQIADIIATF